MKMSHRVPFNKLSSNMEGKVDDAYMREVQRSTDKLEAAYAKAQKRVLSAKRLVESTQQRLKILSAAKDKKAAKREYELAIQLLEQRENELRELKIMMTSTPAGSQHRGTKSHRHIPKA